MLLHLNQKESTSYYSWIIYKTNYCYTRKRQITLVSCIRYGYFYRDDQRVKRRSLVNRLKKEEIIPCRWLALLEPGPASFTSAPDECQIFLRPSWPQHVRIITIRGKKKIDEVNKNINETNILQDNAHTLKFLIEITLNTKSLNLLNNPTHSAANIFK